MTNFTKIAIALGGNFPQTPAFFDFAVKKLMDQCLSRVQIAPVIRTRPVGCVAGTADFYNTVLTGEWAESAQALHHLCRQIELAAGRPSDHRSDEGRVLDLDLILFGEAIINEPDLTIPHPRSQERKFVLAPLAEIAPDWVFPDTGLSVRQCLEKLK